MEAEPSPSPLKKFEYEGRSQPVNFESTSDVTEGVKCDVYTFVNDPTKDLGIIRVGQGHKTPLQRVLQGDRTVEGYLSGKGRLVITRGDGKEEVYEVGTKPQEQLSVDVRVGDLMQWQAAENSNLVVYEICYPPYEDGRYENIV